MGALGYILSEFAGKESLGGGEVGRGRTCHSTQPVTCQERLRVLVRDLVMVKISFLRKV